jgi:hypothetical protein
VSGSSVSTHPNKDLLFASVSTAGSGDTEIVAAVPNKKIRVVNYALVANAAVSAKWKSGSTDKTGAMPFAANGGISCPGSSDSVWFETATGEALNLNLSGAVQVSGHVSYFLEG